jgi:hypothetical protein
LVEEIADVEEAEGVIVWLIVAMAVTLRPFKPRTSGPLTRLKVPVRL